MYQRDFVKDVIVGIDGGWKIGGRLRSLRIKDGKPVISETVFTQQVIDLARWCGWRTAHFRPGMDRHGRWKTAVQGDGTGFFDLVLAKDYVIFAELKTDIGKLEPEQEKWAEVVSLIAEARPGALAYYVWRPRDYDKIMEILQK